MVWHAKRVPAGTRSGVMGTDPVDMHSAECMSAPVAGYPRVGGVGFVAIAC